MKTLLLAGLAATLLATATAYAEAPQSAQPVKGTEGPDVRLVMSRPAAHPVGRTGSDIR
jgi:hypothetical protein